MDLGGKAVPVQKYGYAQTKDKDGKVISGSAEDGSDNLPTRYKLTTKRYVDYEHDTLNRLNKKTLTTDTPFVTSYIYKSSARNTGDSTTYRTTQLSSETIGGTEYSYNYSKVGNITSVKKNGSAYRSYEYDSMSQLERENNQSFGFSKFWNYDSIGNIESVKKYNYTTGSLSGASEGIDYKYSEDSSTGWDRLLTELEYKTYNADGSIKKSYSKYIDYDAIGNPVKYLDHNMSWFGRQLQTINVGANTTDTTADDKTIEFTYDASGLRGTKTVTTGNTKVKSEYVYVNGLLAYEKRGNSELFFFYDTYGHLTAFRYYADASSSDYVQYYAITNSMGDVIGFVHGNGTIVAKYEYDAWGNCEITQDTTSAKIATLNPIRYRGYYWDSETGFYYLQSRYYDPAIGRFLNADVYVSTGVGILGYNMFAYCNNSPIITKDENGEVLCTLLGATVGALTSVLFKSIETDDPEQLKAAAINGAISGAISGAASDVLIFTGGTAGVFVAVGAVAGGVGSAIGTVAESKYLNEEINGTEVLVSAAIGAGTGALFNATSSGAASIKETVTKTVGKYTAKNVVKTVANDFSNNFTINVVTEAVTNFFSWFLGLPFSD